MPSPLAPCSTGTTCVSAPTPRSQPAALRCHFHQPRSRVEQPRCQRLPPAGSGRCARANILFPARPRPRPGGRPLPIPRGRIYSASPGARTGVRLDNLRGRPVPGSMILILGPIPHLGSVQPLRQLLLTAGRYSLVSFARRPAPGRHLVTPHRTRRWGWSRQGLHPLQQHPWGSGGSQTIWASSLPATGSVGQPANTTASRSPAQRQERSSAESQRRALTSGWRGSPVLQRLQHLGHTTSGTAATRAGPLESARPGQVSPLPAPPRGLPSAVAWTKSTRGSSSSSQVFTPSSREAGSAPIPWTIKSIARLVTEHRAGSADVTIGDVSSQLRDALPRPGGLDPRQQLPGRRGDIRVPPPPSRAAWCQPAARSRTSPGAGPGSWPIPGSAKLQGGAGSPAPRSPTKRHRQAPRPAAPSLLRGDGHAKVPGRTDAWVACSRARRRPLKSPPGTAPPRPISTTG